MEVHVPPLLIVLIAAVIAPLLGEATARFGLPVVVFELLLGVAIGPHGLGWATPTGAIPHLALFGMAFLFFLAGLEIDLLAIRQQLRRALLTWLLGFGLAIVAALALKFSGFTPNWQVVAIAMVTTAFGVLIPVLRDNQILDTALGRQVIALGAIGEVGPILAMSLTLSARYTAPLQLLFMVAFLLLVLFISLMMLQAKTPGILRLLHRTMTQSNQLPVRIVMLLLVGIALLANAFGLDGALGALAAGLTIGLATRDLDGSVLHLKLDAIGFGFLVPIFFIASGMKLDIDALFNGGAGLKLTLGFFALIALVRAPVFALYLKPLGARCALSLTLFSATTLSLIVALTEIAIGHGLITPAEGAPLIGAGILTVVFFPALGVKLSGTQFTNIHTSELSGGRNRSTASH